MKKKIPLVFIAAALSCALVLVPVICSFLYFNGVVSARLEITARETVTFYMSQIVDKTGSVLNTLRSSIYYLISDERTQGIMRRDGMPDQLERLAVEEELSRALFVGDKLDPSVVTGIYLVKNEQEYLSVLRSGIFSETARRVLDVYREYSELNAARELYTHPLYPGYCYLIVDYLDLERMNPIGKIIIELSSERLVDTAYIDAIYQQAVVLLRSTDGRQISSAQDVHFSEAARDEPDGYLTVNGETYYHATRPVTPSRVAVDIFVPRREIFAAIEETLDVYIGFTSLLLLAMFTVGAFVLYRLYKPLRQILQKLDRIATGDLTTRMEQTPYRETEQMACAFNNMADRLEDLFDEVYTKGLLLREAEFSLLESQIRPHFIFNVLELINLRCLEAGQSGICRTVSNLAQLIRANITHKGEQTITFEEELRYVRYYLELQKERFEDNLHYTIDLDDPSILKYYLPKLTIQPLVENSIVHGLENKRGGGFVRIGIWEEEDAVCVRVADDGVGFDTSALGLDDPEPESDGTRHNHVALRNINRRIQLLYGKQYGMTIHSAPGRGTDVTIMLPADVGKPPKRRAADA